MTRRHRHVCPCGDFFVCSQEPDQCPIRHWDCPRCEDRARETYLSQLATEQEQTHTQEQEHVYEGQ